MTRQQLIAQYKDQIKECIDFVRADLAEIRDISKRVLTSYLDLPPRGYIRKIEQLSQNVSEIHGIACSKMKMVQQLQTMEEDTPNAS